MQNGECGVLFRDGRTPKESVLELRHFELAPEILFKFRFIEVFLSFGRERTLSLCAEFAKTGQNRS